MSSTSLKKIMKSSHNSTEIKRWSIDFQKWPKYKGHHPWKPNGMTNDKNDQKWKRHQHWKPNSKAEEIKSKRINELNNSREKMKSSHNSTKIKKWSLDYQKGPKWIWVHPWKPNGMTNDIKDQHENGTIPENQMVRPK